MSEQGDPCDICGEKSKWNGVVYYSSVQSWLCRSHYLRWCRVAKEWERKHGDTAGNSKLCHQIEKVYLKWLKDAKREGSKDG